MNQAKWKKIGTKITADNIADAMIEVGGDFSVGTKPIFTQGENLIDGIPVIGQSVPMKAIIRQDNNAVLGVVGENYKPIQNAESFGFFDELVQEKQAKYTYGGIMPNGPYANGSKIFIAADLKDTMKIGPDECKQTVILQSSHDGSSAVNVQFLVYRVICSNGLIAVDKARSNQVKISHTKNYKNRFITARTVLGTAKRYFEEMEKIYNMFYDSLFSDSEMNDLTLKLFPDVDEKNNTRRENTRFQLNNLFKNGAGHNEIANTKWAALNAVAEFSDHKTGKTTKNKNAGVNEFNSAINGPGAKLKNQAYQLLTV